MPQSVEEQILALERAALNHWGQGDTWQIVHTNRSFSKAGLPQ